MGCPVWVFLDECRARLGSFWQGQVTREVWSVLTKTWLAGTPPKSWVTELHSGKLLAVGDGRGWPVKVGNSQGLGRALKMFKLNTVNLLLVFFFFTDGEPKSQKSRKY